VSLLKGGRVSIVIEETYSPSVNFPNSYPEILLGGLVPIGYDVIDRRLQVNQAEAETVREIAIARRRQWAEDLLAGRVESVAVIDQREGVLPNYVPRLTRLAVPGSQDC